MARAVFALITLALAIIFFVIGQGLENGGRIITSQGVYMVAGLSAVCFIITILPGRGKHED